VTPLAHSADQGRVLSEGAFSKVLTRYAVASELATDPGRYHRELAVGKSTETLEMAEVAFTATTAIAIAYEVSFEEAQEQIRFLGLEGAQRWALQHPHEPKTDAEVSASEDALRRATRDGQETEAREQAARLVRQRARNVTRRIE
jgi:hypothetical protein